MLNFYKRFDELLRLRKYVKRFVFRNCIILKGYRSYYYCDLIVIIVKLQQNCFLILLKCFVFNDIF